VIIALLAFVMWLVHRAAREGREISFWPPRIGPRDSISLNSSSAAELKAESSTLVGEAPPIPALKDSAYDDTDTNKWSAKCGFVKLVGVPLAGLFVENGSDFGKWFFITNMSSRVTVGREPSCEVSVSGDQRISRLHFRIEVSRTPERETLPYSFTIIDAASGNGTFLNGKEVERQELMHLDIIQIGDVRLQFHILSHKKAS
jgi:hypothetical protein